MTKRVLFLLGIFGGSVLWMALLKLPFMALYLLEGYSLAQWAAVVGHGFSLDMTVAGYITALPWLITLLELWIPLHRSVWRTILWLVLGSLSLAATAIYTLDLGLYGYWGFRIDASILLYLQTPKEAMASLSAADWVRGTIAFLVIGVGFLLLYRALIRRFWSDSKGSKEAKTTLATRLWGTPVLFLLGGLCFLAIRGGLSVATANISKVYFSADPRLNHAAINPLFSLLSTIGDDKDMAPQYLFYDEPEREAHLQELRGEGSDTLRSASHLKTTRPDVVIILLESFGRVFTDAEVDGEPVTAHLQGWKSRGLWFENLYANSFRTDRGEVAVLNGYPAQTRMSIMKYPNKSHSLPSIARSLTETGYTSWFAYGGDLNFTDQASYMYATGWQELSWQKGLKFDAPQSKWGYADDVMSDYFTSELLRRLAVEPSKRAPLLAGWLTLSSHEPFEVPYDKFEDKILNAVAFTDEQVGRLLERLSQSPAWENLLVILVADHGYAYPATVAYNAEARHRIPMLWLGGALSETGEVLQYASQHDLAATLLAELGIPYEEFLFSRDIFNEAVPHFGYWCFNDGFGVADSRGVTLYDCTSEQLLEESDPASSEERLRWGKTLLQSTYKDIRER